MNIENLDILINEAIDSQIFPGATIAFGNSKNILYSNAYGYHTYCKKRKTKTDDIFDLASLTKVVATTTAIMMLFDKSKIDLEQSYFNYLKNYSITEDKRNITVRQLLSHCSGYPSSNRYIRSDKFSCPSQRWKELIENTNLEYETGRDTVYSDVNFQILGKIVESVTEKPLDKFINENLFQKLNMENTFFNPPVEIRQRIIPTEFDPGYNELAKGYVHDPNARLLNGVAGHAGLFSNVFDLSRFCKMLLNKGCFNEQQIIKTSTIESFFKRDKTMKDSSRALGWDTAYMPELQSKSMSYSAGTHDDENSFGHTGFTGTSIWINVNRNFYSIILTNRVCPSRNHSDIENYKKHISKISSTIWKYINIIY